MTKLRLPIYINNAVPQDTTIHINMDQLNLLTVPFVNCLYLASYAMLYFQAPLFTLPYVSPCLNSSLAECYHRPKTLAMSVKFSSITSWSPLVLSDLEIFSTQSSLQADIVYLTNEREFPKLSSPTLFESELCRGRIDVILMYD